MMTEEKSGTEAIQATGSMRILVADDDEIQKRLLTNWLTKQGHEVKTASDGAQAWELIQGGSFNMLITDWVMPGLSGLELTRNVRAARFGRYVYIIVSTAKSSQADLIDAMKMGADDFLRKPVEKDELWVRVAAGERVVNLEKRLEEENKRLAETNQRLSQAYQTIQEDLQAGAMMQRSLLPSPATIQKLHFDSLFLPASAVAGDIFNYFPLNDRAVGFYGLDVSGHGIPAAMLSVTLSKMLSTRPLQSSPLVQRLPKSEEYSVKPPHEAISELNRRFQSQGDMYFTIAYGVIDQQERRLRLAQAGHPNPILLRQGKPPLALGDGGFPVGVMPDMTYELLDHEIDKGDRLFLTSDGILECTNRHGEQFGVARLMEFLDKHRRCSLNMMMQSLEWTVQSWTESQEFEDDLSLLAMEMS